MNQAFAVLFFEANFQESLLNTSFCWIFLNKLPAKFSVTIFWKVQKAPEKEIEKLSQSFHRLPAPLQSQNICFTFFLAPKEGKLLLHAIKYFFDIKNYSTQKIIFTKIMDSRVDARKGFFFNKLLASHTFRSRLSSSSHQWIQK